MVDQTTVGPGTPGVAIARRTPTAHGSPDVETNWVINHGFDLRPTVLRRVYAWTTLLALVHYVIITPGARVELGDPDRITELLSQLRHDSGSLPHVQTRRPLMGDRLDLHNALEPILARLWPRRALGRPFAGEPIPIIADVVAELQRSGPPRLLQRSSTEEISAYVTRLVSEPPWQFGALVKGD